MQAVSTGPPNLSRRATSPDRYPSRCGFLPQRRGPRGPFCIAEKKTLEVNPLQKTLYKFRNLWHFSKQEEGPCSSTRSASASRGLIDERKSGMLGRGHPKKLNIDSPFCRSGPGTAKPRPGRPAGSAGARASAGSRRSPKPTDPAATPTTPSTRCVRSPLPPGASSPTTARRASAISRSASMPAAARTGGPIRARRPGTPTPNGSSAASQRPSWPPPRMCGSTTAPP